MMPVMLFIDCLRKITSIFCRIIKEKNMYEKEFISLLEIVDKMVANKKCEHDIRKQAGNFFI